MPSVLAVTRVPPLVLSVFPGIDLLGRGFEEEGFTIVRGPDPLWGGDVRTFHPPAGRFDGVIGGPPCQCFSRIRHLSDVWRATASVKPREPEKPINLIPEFERVVAEAEPLWFVMENVQAAPLPVVDGYLVESVVVNNRWLGEEQNRVRRFSFGTLARMPAARFSLASEYVALEVVDYAPAVLASGSQWVADWRGGGADKRRKKGGVWGFKTVAFFKQARKLQGLPDEWDLPGFTVREKIRALGNAVPLPMARAVARAVQRALNQGAAEVAA